MNIRALLTKYIHVFILAACIGYVIFPLIQPGFFVTDDGDWMVIRLSAFYQSLRLGQFPVRFLGRLNYGYGYPVANFLYPGFLYIGSFFHLLGVPYVSVVKLLFASSVIVSGIFVFLFLRRIYSRFASTVGAGMYILAPYIAFDIYKRGSVGEILVLPFATGLLYALAAKKYYLVPVMTALTIVSHNSLAIMFIPFALAYAYTQSGKKSFPGFIIGLGMAGFFWIPALYERKYVVFDSVIVSDPGRYFLTPNTIWLIGTGFILSVCIALTQKKVQHFQKPLFFMSVFLLCVFFVTPASFFLWEYPGFMRIVQFPYRFAALALFAGPVVSAYILHHMKHRPLQMLTAGILIVIQSIPTVVYISTVDYVDRPEGYYTTNEATTTVQDEYMPVWVKNPVKEHARERLTFHDGGGIIEAKTATSQTIDAVVHSKSNSILQINSVYYPGWGVLVDGKRVPILYKNDDGLIRFAVSTGTHTVFAAFRETVGRFVSDVISLFSFIVFLVYSYTGKKKHGTI